MQSFSEQIVDYRKKKGWNQKDLADKVGISRDYVSKIENGREPGPRLRAFLQEMIAAEASEKLEKDTSSHNTGKTEAGADSEDSSSLGEESGSYLGAERRSLLELRLDERHWTTLEACSSATGMDAESLLRTLLAALGRSLTEGVPRMPWVIEHQTVEDPESLQDPDDPDDPVDGEYQEDREDSSD